jgi:membrane protease YdiL (CAAX protease family)
MSTNIGSTHQPTRLSVRAALGFILLLGFVYTVHFASYQYGPIYELLRFVPGLLGVCALLTAGIATKDCYLKFAPISKPSILVYAVLLFLMLPVVITGLQSGGWAGIDWRLIFINAPIDAISQELFFRAALLPALLLVMPRKPRFALVLHAMIFAFYHIGMFRVAPPGAAVSALFLTFLIGLGWGWQVKRDGTIVWAMIHHTILQIILKLFAWG